MFGLDLKPIRLSVDLSTFLCQHNFVLANKTNQRFVNTETSVNRRLAFNFFDKMHFQNINTLIQGLVLKLH